MCEGDGATLAVALTVDDVDALKHYQQKAGSKLWIGLKGNADLQNVCTDNQCSYLLDWDDGTRFIFSSLYHSIEAEKRDPCMTFRSTSDSSLLKRSKCRYNEAFVCQFTCSSEIIAFI